MKRFGTGRIVTTLGLTAWVVAGGAAAQDAKKGKAAFNQCMACHMLDKAMVGPPLGGIVGRKAGAADGYAYSPLLKAAGEAGLTWTDANLVDYLTDPTEYLKKFVADKGKTASGASKMSFKLSGEQPRKDVVAYLATEKGK